MTDRLVRIVTASPPIGESEGLRTFAQFNEYANIVLLGDPGAGKSHLFRHVADAEAATLVTARSFLNRPVQAGIESLYIDALDEKRSGRGDHATIDAIVAKLFEAKPNKVRISCRVHDWLGDTDLVALRDYFDGHGGLVVLTLDELTVDERNKIIATQEFGDVDAFIAEASSRKLENLLINPQNLVMLCEVVRKKGWPATRTDLYASMTQILLAEHNRNKIHAGEGVYSSAELMDAAGAVCAARLISDIEALSRAEASDDRDIPSYRTLRCENLERIGASLGRRLFVSVPGTEAVDYVHRTVAEYLAASWLSRSIRAGLPFGRVRALIGVDGHPTSELRGLHSWLAILLPEYASVLIEADPYGVLTYGDAASLTPSLRKCLLQSLGRLSQADPWFRNDTWSIPALGALSTPDMGDDIRAILRSTTANFSLRSCALQALAYGTPLPSLQPDLEAILINEQATYAERSDALDALVRYGPSGEAAVLTAFGGLPNTANSLRLRAEILSTLYRDNFKPSNVCEYLSEVLESDHEVPIGTLWRLGSNLPIEDVLAILDGMPQAEKKARGKAERRRASELSYLFDSLLIRVLENDAGHVDSPRLWTWLATRQRLRDVYSATVNDSLKEALGRRKNLLIQTVQVAVDQLVVDRARWRFIHHLRQATMQQIDEHDLLDALLQATTACNSDREKQKFLFELTLVLSFDPSGRAQSVFDALSELAATQPDLQQIFDRNLSCPLEEWREEDAQRRARQTAKNDAARQQNLREFAESKQAIERGVHKSWMAWLAELCLARFGDVDKNALPRERIAKELGEENASTAIEGLLTLALGDDIPSLDETISVLAEDQYFKWWFAIIAGLDEASRQGIDTRGLPVATLQTALVIGIDLLLFSDEADKLRTWKSQFIAERPEQAKDALLALVKAKLAQGKEPVSGLHELLNDEWLAPLRGTVVVDLLRAFPNAGFNVLEDMLQCALKTSEAPNELSAIAEEVIEGKLLVDEGQMQLWLATAFLLDPARHEARISGIDDASLVWRLRDLSGSDQRSTATKLGFLASYSARYFPACGHPSDGWSGDQNPWDGAEFVRNTINRISTLTTPSATVVLEGFVTRPEFASYSEHVRHALANQRARRREAEYQQPDWRQTVDALSNGPPASAADLHALIASQVHDANAKIAGNNADLYKQFWNEDSHRRLISPKAEESCRDALLGLLRPGLTPLGISLEPEGHMATDKRADMVALCKGNLKAVVELKRDTHADVWTALSTQLDRLYARDQETSGFGLYGVFWFGSKRKGSVPVGPQEQRPTTARELEAMLKASVPEQCKERLDVIVIDVSDLNER